MSFLQPKAGRRAEHGGPTAALFLMQTGLPLVLLATWATLPTFSPAPTNTPSSISSAVFQPFHPSPAALCGAVVALGLVEPHPIGFSLVLPSLLRGASLSSHWALSAAVLLCRAMNSSEVEALGIKMLPGYKDPYHGRPLTKGELGCFLSHYRIWKEVSGARKQEELGWLSVGYRWYHRIPKVGRDPLGRPARRPPISSRRSSSLDAKPKCPLNARRLGDSSPPCAARCTAWHLVEQ